MNSVTLTVSALIATITKASSLPVSASMSIDDNLINYQLVQVVMFN